MTEWLDEQLAAHGIRRTGEPELIRERTWAGVHRVPTTAGPVWLKTMPAATAFEARLYEVLHRHAARWVLAPLATAPGRVLLPEAGPSLADRDAADELPRALHAYGTLQLALAPHVDELLEAGVTDMRPERMPERFDEAMAVATSCARGRREDVGELAALRPRYRDWCAELVASGRPASLDHNDLHLANVVGTPTQPRFYDWGDAVVAHPFACLLTPLDTSDAGARDGLRDAYLRAFGDPVELRAEAALACRVALVARALVWVRALGERPDEHEHAAAPLAVLRRLLDPDEFRRAGEDTAGRP